MYINTTHKRTVNLHNVLLKEISYKHGNKIPTENICKENVSFTKTDIHLPDGDFLV
jgi:hypothetical protein